MPEQTEFPDDLVRYLLDKWSSRTLLKTPGDSLRFDEYFRKSWSISTKLASKRGQPVVILSRDLQFVLIAFWAIWMRGSIAVPVNPAFPKSRIRQLMKLCGSCLLITDLSSFQQNLEKIQIHHPQSLIAEAGHVSDTLWPSIHEDDPALVIFTSGSTGRPKATVLSLGNLYFSAAGANSQMSLGPGNRWLMSLPLYHIGGLGILFRCLLSGAAMVLAEPALSLEDQLRLENITHLSMVPTQLIRLLESKNGSGLLQKLQLILLGGASQPSFLLKKSMNLGLCLRTSYGCTEMASQIATGKPEHEHGRWVASGPVLPHREVRLSADGEIMVRGKTRFLGYLNEKKKTEQLSLQVLDQPFDQNGWFATGDLGEWCKKDGQEPLLRMKGRKDTMFVTGGENIHPEEIEARLQEHPGVRQAVVVPVDDREYGTRPVAFLTGKDENGHPAEQELRLHLSDHLARYQIPDLFLALDGQNSLAKPQRTELSRIAQPRYETWKKLEPLRTWLRGKTAGWKKILLCDEKQVFEVRSHLSKRSKYAYFCASNRQEVMDFLCLVSTKELKRGDWKTCNDSDGEPGSVEPYEIIRLVEEDCAWTELNVWDIANKNPQRNMKRVDLPYESFTNNKSIEYHSGNVKLDQQNVEYGFCAPGWDPLPKTAFLQAVYQSGVMLLSWNRLYLLRCLYSIESKKKALFLGWKVHCLLDMNTGFEKMQPIWEMKPQEERLIESILIRQNLVPGPDLENTNTPEKDRERRRLFDALLKKHRV